MKYKKLITDLGLSSNKISKELFGESLKAIDLDDSEYYVVTADELPVVSEYKHIIENGITGYISKIQNDMLNVIDLVMDSAMLLEEVNYEDLDLDVQFILGEATYKDLRFKAPNYLDVRGKMKRATQIPKYKGVDKDNIVEWEIESFTKPGIVYQQYIKLMTMEDILKNRDGSKNPIDLVRQALQGDIEVHCTDPSWKYWGFQYIGTANDYALHAEPRFPHIRNPHLKGSICKHLDAILLVLPFWSSRITSDMKKQGRFN